MINKVILVGNLGKDPEERQLDNGALLVRFSLATGENYRDRDGNWQSRTEWHDVVMWRTQAERAKASLRKGMMVYLEGKLRTRKWQDNDGNDRRTTEIEGLNFKVLNRPAQDAGLNQAASTATQSVSTQSSTPPPPADDKDVPF